MISIQFLIGKCPDLKRHIMKKLPQTLGILLKHLRWEARIINAIALSVLLRHLFRWWELLQFSFPLLFGIEIIVYFLAFLAFCCNSRSGHCKRKPQLQKTNKKKLNMEIPLPR